jgi:hypothetical protein
MRACPRTPNVTPGAMQVSLTFELAPGVRSDMLICMLLNTLFAELTSAGLGASHIAIDIGHYRPDDID